MAVQIRKFEQEAIVESIFKQVNSGIKKKANDFVFTAKNSKHPLSERAFQQAFEKYCGEKFYPHIVRSHYATMAVKHYIKGKRKLKKEDVDHLYLSIAKDLGHKRFLKKTGAWQNNSAITVNYYVDPVLVARVERMKK